eukprot:gene49013-65711_t
MLLCCDMEIWINWSSSKQQLSPTGEIIISISAVENFDEEFTFVGKGGLPNAIGELELDAAIMNHNRRYGAVMCLKDIVNPISVARSVMEKCVHNILSGDGALSWALANGFTR